MAEREGYLPGVALTLAQVCLHAAPAASGRLTTWGSQMLPDAIYSLSASLLGGIGKPGGGCHRTVESPPRRAVSPVASR